MFENTPRIKRMVFDMLKLTKSKRGEKEFWAADTWIFYLISFFLLNLFVLGFLVVLNNDAAASTEIPKSLEEFTIKNLLSGSCFSYTDEGILSSRIIDLIKFTSDNLDRCLKPGKPHKLTLKFNSEEISITTQNWIKGRQATERFPIEEVLINNKNEISKSDLIIEVQ